MRHKQWKKRSLSLLLAFSMVTSLFTGQAVSTRGALANVKQASDEAQIILNDLEKGANGTYYTYPDATVSYPDPDKKFHNLTISVDCGHLKVASTEIAGTTGVGVVAGSDMNVDFEDLSISSKYESITFEWAEGADIDSIQSYIRTIQFTTSNRNQTVSIYATTKSSAELKTSVNGQEIQLYYFNGHYYGYVPMTMNNTWAYAYKESKSATFCGAQGYLATLTSRAEDRFILANFKEYGNFAKKGWLGCSRAVLAEGSSYADADTEWKELATFNESTCQQDFVWRWVSGPEAGERFGYQNHAFGDGTYGDGGFITDNNKFSNWNNSSNIEPNGGASTKEAYGYYGKYEYGRWNDNENNSSDGVWGYYIEFGGYTGDDEKFETELDQIIISTTKVTDEIITDGSYTDSDNNDDSDDETVISGKPVIVNQTTDDDDNPIIKEGSILTADVSGIIPDSAYDSLSYQWYIQNTDGTLNPINGAINKSFALTTDTINKKLVVKVFASGEYTGEVTSDPYDTTRTNSSIDTEENEDDSDDKGTLVIYPTVEGTVYGIKDEEGNVYGLGSLDALPAVDGDGNELTPNVSGYPGYYQVEAGGKIVFTIDTDKNYIVHEIKADSTNTEVVSPTIPDSDITTDYDTNNSTDTEDDTISIVVDPALTDYKYAVLKKENGVYVQVPVTKDEDGNYVASPSTSTNPWTDGDEEIVTFTGLPADGTYKIIAVTTNDSADTAIGELKPEEVIGGSNDITVAAPSDVKTPISGKPVIVNQTIDDDGNSIVKEGSLLTATLTSVTPITCHTSLTFQWYIKNDDDSLTPIDGATTQNYTLTADTIDKELVVKAFASGNYTGEVESNPYDTTRTNSGIDVGGEDIDPIPGATPLPDDKRIITINPTMANTIYAIKDENGNVYGAGELGALPAVDGNGNSLSPNVSDPSYAGYYQVDAGGKIIFTVDKDKNYIIHEVKNTATNTEVISPTIPDSNISTNYDDNGTQNNKDDDTISITVDPALTDYKYAVLKKVDGKYIEVTVAKDANGNYAVNSDSDTPWSNGGESKITFTGLPADGTYRIVAVSASDSADTIIKDLTPDQIIGGSSDITSTPNPAPSVSPSVTPSASPSMVPSVSPSAAPAASSSAIPGGTSFTQSELDNAEAFIKEHGTDPFGNVITEITDLTRDIVVSGETKWNNFTDKEKAAVNEKLKEKGCPYTFQQLLDMAKQYKIPGFKLKKVMKKKTKATLKLIKCKGATIVCTSTNKKVATVNKKGIIKAKKVGKATLTFTAIKGEYTNRLVIKIVVRKKFKNAKELKKFKSKRIKTPTVLIAKKRVIKKSTKIRIHDLEKTSKVKFTAYNKKVLKLTKKGKYTGKKLGSSLVQVKINQNDKVYLLYVYVTIFKKGKK